MLDPRASRNRASLYGLPVHQYDLSFSGAFVSRAQSRPDRLPANLLVRNHRLRIVSKVMTAGARVVSARTEVSTPSTFLLLFVLHGNIDLGCDQSAFISVRNSRQNGCILVQALERLARDRRSRRALVETSTLNSVAKLAYLCLIMEIVWSTSPHLLQSYARIHGLLCGVNSHVNMVGSAWNFPFIAFQKEAASKPTVSAAQ